MCVRVENMAGIDLSRYRFDYDLTFAILLLDSKGGLLHHYGNRTGKGPDSHLSMASLAALLRTAKAALADGTAEPRPALAEAETIEQLPTMARRIRQGKAPDCFHCHMVHQAHREAADEAGGWDAREIWEWSPSTRIGLVTDRDAQTRVVEVSADSPAAAAGIEAGDELRRLAGRRIASEGDVQAALQTVAWNGGPVPFEVVRAGESVRGELELSEGWRRSTPRDVSWRPTMWHLSPKPGFGGPQLGANALAKHDLPADSFAFRVQYLVTWGPNAHTGRAAAKAGIRKGDVVVSVDGRNDFESVMHFHAWFRLTRNVGDTVEIELIRGGERRTISLQTKQ